MNIVTLILTGVSITSDIINSKITTPQVGDLPGLEKTKKPGGDQTPYFFSADDAAEY